VLNIGTAIMVTSENNITRNRLDFIVSSVLKQVRIGSLSRAAMLVALADQAITTRQTRKLSVISNGLLKLPLPDDIEYIQRYYQAVALHDFGRGDSERALSLQLEVAERAPLKYRARGLDAAGAIFLRQSRIAEASRLYAEAARIDDNLFLSDPLSHIRRITNVSIILAEQGDQKSSLKVLEAAKPRIDNLAGYYPAEYGNYLNNYTVGLSEYGRIEEAGHYINLALASPFAFAYPEWRETRDELERRGWRSSRSVVAVPGKVSLDNNVTYIRSALGKSSPVHSTGPCAPAKVLTSSKWKKTSMNKQPGPGLGKQQFDKLKELSHIEKQNEVVKLILLEGTEDDFLDYVIEEYAKRQAAKANHQETDREQGT
jgi:hypothetical protein